MKLVLHITYSGAGGMTEAVLTLLDAAVKTHGPRHFILFYGSDELPEKIVLRCRNLGVDYDFIKKGRGNDLPSLFHILHLLKRLQPDVIYSHMTQPLPPLLWHRLSHRDCRIISIEHHSNALKSRKDWILTRANHVLTDHSVYLTSQYRDEVQNRIRPFFRPRKATIIPNGVDTDRFSPSAKPSEPSPILIGMTARMVPGKDFVTLLHAFQSVLHRRPSSGLRLQLAGDGPLRTSLVVLSRELGLEASVDFLGDLTQDELISTMRSWQIFVLSTLGETMSRSIMEAQSLGLPILSTLVPGVSAAIESGKTGLLIAPGDVPALAQALELLLESPSLRSELGRNARDKALNDFSATEIWQRYQKLSLSLFSN